MPSVAEEPFRKWPREESVSNSSLRLVKISSCDKADKRGQCSWHIALVEEHGGQCKGGDYLPMFLAFGGRPGVMSGVFSRVKVRGGKRTMVVLVIWVGINLQGSIHFCKGAHGLLEESINNALREFPLLLIIVHLENLFEGERIDRVTAVGQNARLGLWGTSQHASPKL